MTAREWRGGYNSLDIRLDALGGFLRATLIFLVFGQSAPLAAFFCPLVEISRSIAPGRENPYGSLTDGAGEIGHRGGMRHGVARPLPVGASLGIQGSWDASLMEISAEARGCAARFWGAASPLCEAVTGLLLGRMCCAQRVLC